jgi:MFS family permease
MVLAVVCVGYFLVLLDVTALNVAVPTIGAGLGVGVTALQWVVNGYALALAALLLVGGALGDANGHRRVVLAGLALFGAASAGCGLAPTVGVLVAARVLQGVGAALLLPGTLAIITRTFPEPAAQARAIGVWAGVGSVALPAGPVLGGGLVATWGWRSVFLVNVPVVLVAALGTLRTVRSDRVDGSHLDLDGLVRAVLGLLRRPAFAVANAVAAAMNFGSLGLLFLLSLFLQTVQQRSASAAGAAVLPLFLPLVVFAPLAGRATARWGTAADDARRPRRRRGRGRAAFVVGRHDPVRRPSARDAGLGHRTGRAHPGGRRGGLGGGPAAVRGPRFGDQQHGTAGGRRGRGRPLRVGRRLTRRPGAVPRRAAPHRVGHGRPVPGGRGLDSHRGACEIVTGARRTLTTVSPWSRQRRRPWAGSSSSPGAAAASAVPQRRGSPPPGTTS